MKENDCYWGFQKGKMIIRDQTFELEGKELPVKQICRVYAQEDIVIPRSSETITPGRLVFDKVQDVGAENQGELATCSGLLRNDLYAARVMYHHNVLMFLYGY